MVSNVYVTYEPRLTESSSGTCPAADIREAVRNQIQDDIRQLPEMRQLLYPNIFAYTCGGTSGWARAVHLNMTNSSHSCPWRRP